MMKVAFTSCSNVQDYPSQPGWKRLKDLKPDVLLLLGDQIYMDFGIKLMGGDLYKPAGMSLPEFAECMYSRYKQQWGVPEMRDFLQSCPEMRIGAIWDDHDFAWNNACGGRAGDPPDEKHHVPDEKKRIARALFRQYLDTLTSRASAYPEPPFNLAQSEPDAAANAEGVQDYFDLDSGAIRVILLDNRFHRDCPTAADALIMDEAQCMWMETLLAGPQDFTLLCSGTTLTDSECWKNYPVSYRKLLDAVNGKKVLFLSGDIHRNKFITHQQPGKYPLFEAISSGVAVKGYLPPPFIGKWWGRQENFGLIEIVPERVKIDLYHNGSCDETHQLERSSWHECD